MRYEIECCRNCEGRDDKGFCEDILEPLRRGWGLDGIGPLQMPDSAHCKMFRVSESFRQEEEAAERDMDDTMGKPAPTPKQFDWENHYGLR